MMLIQYLETRYPNAPAAEQAAFAQLLECSNLKIEALLAATETAEDPVTQDLVQQMIQDQRSASV